MTAILEISDGSRTPVAPISITVFATISKAAAKGRPSNAPVLLQKDGKPWSETDPSSGYKKGVRATAKKIGLDPDVYGLYAFRHTSITRMLLKGIHTSIVAKAHDTSEGMIRKHYAASILDFTDEITRKSLPSLLLPEPPPANVVPLPKRG